MNEIATIDDAVQLPTLPTPAGAIVPRTIPDALRYAELVCSAGLAPDSYTKGGRWGRDDLPPDEVAKRVTLGILKGMEVGLAPMTALANIAIINGRPCLHSDGGIALAHASGKVEYIKEWLEGEGDSRKAVCEVKRKDQTAPTRRTFSVDDAKRAKLWANAKREPWIRYPQRMLAARARSWALRDAFADVLSGLGIQEEVEDMTPTTETEAVDLSYLDDDGGSLPEIATSDDDNPPPMGEIEPPRKRGNEQQARAFLSDAINALALMEAREDVDAYTLSKAGPITAIKNDWPEIGAEIERAIMARRDELPAVAA